MTGNGLGADGGEKSTTTGMGLLQSVRCPSNQALKLDSICLLPVIPELQLLAPKRTYAAKNTSVLK
mgnify:CR=1 FL=1